jgi:hypothetical protein
MIMVAFKARKQGFHGQVDKPWFNPKPWREMKGYERLTTTVTRALSYRLVPNFHPYARAMTSRLVETSFAGLQAMDTEYVESAKNRRDVLPGSVRVLIETGDHRGEMVTLPDGTGLRRGDGTIATLPGRLLIDARDRLEVPRDGGGEIVLDPTVALTLVATAEARWSDGRLVSLAAGTAVRLVGAKPRPLLFEPICSETRYKPSDLIRTPYPVRDLDFTFRGPYAVYNWEIFYHAPLAIAMHLSRNQRFEEAQRWLHVIFDPTDASAGPSPDRFWKVKPFQYADVKRIDEIMINLSSRADPELWEETRLSIQAANENPFRPHVIARYRPTAYMLKTVIAYLDNLIAWGDSLFRQDTIETINEAAQIYVLAANILGPRPQPVPQRIGAAARTYHGMRDRLDEFSNTLIDIETDLPFDIMAAPAGVASDGRTITLAGLARTLYFGVPRNDKLLTYWDIVADRLFKIHNSLNLQGIFRQLPLFDPPIDPAMLVRAAAAGLDVAAVIEGIAQPLPLVRFQLLVQKAAELAQEVKGLGAAVLGAMEKEDSEALSVLRARHEHTALELAKTSKYAQWQEAIKARQALKKSLGNAAERYVHYERLLGRNASEIEIPSLTDIDRAQLNDLKLRAMEPVIARREVDYSLFLGNSTSDAIGLHLNTWEATTLIMHSLAIPFDIIAAVADGVAAATRPIPKVEALAAPLGVGISTEMRGQDISDTASKVGLISRTIGIGLDKAAGVTAQVGSFLRREQEWAQQSNAAAGEIDQVLVQLRAAEIREAMAERDYLNHDKLIANAKEIMRFLDDENEPKTAKKTSKGLYAWMKREVRGLYGQCFQLAFDVAKKAERALQHELGNPELTFLRFDYQGGREGLLAGEKLHLDIKRMEMAYHENNRREYELTKHVSLMQLDPRALLMLRTTGACTVSLPIWIAPGITSGASAPLRYRSPPWSDPMPASTARSRSTAAGSASGRSRATATRAATMTSASTATRGACNRSSPAAGRTTAASSRGQRAMSDICHLRVPV